MQLVQEPRVRDCRLQERRLPKPPVANRYWLVIHPVTRNLKEQFIILANPHLETTMVLSVTDRSTQCRVSGAKAGLSAWR